MGFALNTDAGTQSIPAGTDRIPTSKCNYYRFEDLVWQTLRSELRNIRYNQYNFELQRFAVRFAAQQITINEDLRQIGETLGLSSGPTAARDSITALNDLLTAQNQFLGVWVFYEVQRRNLDQDLGTIRVDGENIWCDPGDITSAAYGFENEVPQQDQANLEPAPILNVNSNDVSEFVAPVISNGTSGRLALRPMLLYVPYLNLNCRSL